MGIDVYMKWNGQTKDESDKQITGFSIEHGHAGYLREAYHGGPYVTRFLVREAFASDDATAQIPAAVLRERLEEAIEIAKDRSMAVYREKLDNDSPVIRSFIEFVELAEQMEKKTGSPVTIFASY